MNFPKVGATALTKDTKKEIRSQENLVQAHKEMVYSGSCMGKVQKK